MGFGIGGTRCPPPGPAVRARGAQLYPQLHFHSRLYKPLYIAHLFILAGKGLGTGAMARVGGTWGVLVLTSRSPHSPAAYTPGSQGLAVLLRVRAALCPLPSSVPS